MRILLLTTYFQPDASANGMIMSKLTDEFIARGHDVSVVTTVPHYDINQIWPEFRGRLQFVERSKNLKIFRLYTYVARDKSNIFQRLLAYASFSFLALIRCLTLPNHDVLLVPSPPLSNGVIADIVRRFRRIPFVYNVQDIWPDVAVRAGILKSERTIRRLRRMEDFVYEKAARVTVISDGFRENLLAKGVANGKMEVIPNFTETDFISPRPKDNPFSRKHEIADCFVVLFAGNMGFSQGLDTVLDTARLLTEYPTIRFFLVGNGAARDRLAARLKEMKLSNTQMLEYQPRDLVPDMYASSDVCLIPLKRGFTTESTPSKLFSIMAAARPAIAGVDFDSETSKLLQSVQCGLVVPPEDARALADAIIHYMDNDTERREAGRNGRRCVEDHYQPEKIAEKYLEILQRAGNHRM